MHESAAAHLSARVSSARGDGAARRRGLALLLWGVLFLVVFWMPVAVSAQEAEVHVSDRASNSATDHASPLKMPAAPSPALAAQAARPAERLASGVLPAEGASGSELAGPLSATSEAPQPLEECPACGGPAPRHCYLEFGTLLWWMKGDQTPALLTTSPIGTPASDIGVMGKSTTTVLFGDEPVNDMIRGGVMLQSGAWVNEARTIAVESSFFVLPSVSTTYEAGSRFTNNSLQDEILARPVFNAAPGIRQQQAIVVAAPDYPFGQQLRDVDGGIGIEEWSEVSSVGVGLRIALARPEQPRRFMLLAGYRYFHLEEGLSIVSESMQLQFFQLRDRFATGNIFNGGELGLATELARQRWSLNAETRIALGNMHQTLDIHGRTLVISSGPMAYYQGGLLAQPSNIGHYSSDSFSVIPQLDLKLAYQSRAGFRYIVGYNFVYVTNVARPGDQIATRMDAPIVGTSQPPAEIEKTDVWLQGLTLALEIRY